MYTVCSVAAFALCFHTVAADVIACGVLLCNGEDPYCCYHDDENLGCCYGSEVYDNWWFWFVWVMIFLMVLACTLSCWRRRRARMRYMVMNNSQYPVYGTVVHAAPTYPNGNPNSAPAYPNPNVVPGVRPYHVNGAVAAQAMPTAPVKPPGYAEATSKPPPYTR